MSMPGGHFRVFISWLRLILRTISSRSYTAFLTVLRLSRVQHRQTVVGGNERALRERGLALSSQPTDQDSLTASVSLAVPLLEAPLLQSEGCQPGTSAQIPTSEGSNGVGFSTQIPQNSFPPSIPSSTPESTASIKPFDITLTPIIPSQIMRYDRKLHIRDEYMVFQVEKGPLDCTEELAPVAGWQPLTHPEGALFFYHPYKRIFTEADVRDPETVINLGRAAEKAYEQARSANISLHPSVELALELMQGDDGKEVSGYYFADHDRRVIFWFEDHKSDLLMNNVRGVEHKDHVRYALESQYWRHIELFPNKRFLPEGVVMRLKEIVMHAQAENITSDTCLAPFGPDEVAGMLGLMDPLMSSANKEHEYSVWVVARFMRLFYNAKFVNFCGQAGARLDTDQSLYGDGSMRRKSIVLRIMNVILFGSPEAHAKGLHRIWVDGIIVQPRWKNFIERLNSEWNGYTIFSTVMLAVDISFLGVPSVQNRMAVILVSYLSTLCAMGSLVVSLLLAGQVNDSRRDTAKGAALFMVEVSQSMLGLESLAMMLSLPFSLLIWGMTFFAAALSIVIFQTCDTVSISIASPIWVAVIILATWPMLAANDIHIVDVRRWIVNWVLRYGSSSSSLRIDYNSNV